MFVRRCFYVFVPYSLTSQFNISTKTPPPLSTIHCAMTFIFILLSGNCVDAFCYSCLLLVPNVVHEQKIRANGTFLYFFFENDFSSKAK